MNTPVSDELVPDPQVAREFGVSLMTLWRWTHDATMDFPAAAKIRNRNYRSRRALDTYKQRVIQNAQRDKAS